MYAVLPVLSGLHELRWYLEEVLARAVAAPVHAAARAARDAIADGSTAAAGGAARPRPRRAPRAVDPLLRRASALVRAAYRGARQSRRSPGGDLARRDLRRTRSAPAPG